MYLEDDILKAQLLGEGYTWYDTGTPDSMLDAANMIQAIEEQGNRVICCPEKIAYDHNWMSNEKLEEKAELMKKNNYGKYLRKVLDIRKR